MDSLFGLDRVSHHDEELAHLTTVHDPIQRAIVESILRDAEIPYLIKERGSGSAVSLIAGYSVMGSDFFVRPNDVETARILITPPVENGEADEEIDQ